MVSRGLRTLALGALLFSSVEAGTAVHSAHTREVVEDSKVTRDDSRESESADAGVVGVVDLSKLSKPHGLKKGSSGTRKSAPSVLEKKDQPPQ